MATQQRCIFDKTESRAEMDISWVFSLALRN
jgi:hypothetical protein